MHKKITSTVSVGSMEYCKDSIKFELYTTMTEEAVV